MTNRIDVISIASFDNFHAEQVIHSLNSQKHVFVEKPLCLNRREFLNIFDSMKTNPV